MNITIDRTMCRLEAVSTLHLKKNNELHIRPILELIAADKFCRCLSICIWASYSPEEYDDDGNKIQYYLGVNYFPNDEIQFRECVHELLNWMRDRERGETYLDEIYDFSFGEPKNKAWSFFPDLGCVREIY